MKQHVRRLAFRSLYERWHSFADEMSALQLVRLQAIALAKAVTWSASWAMTNLRW